jgi:hypothetical protein
VPPDAVLFSGGGNLRPSEWSSVLGAVLDLLGQTFGAPPQGGRPTTRGGALPPQVTLAVAGRRPFSFSRTGEDAQLEATFLPRLATGALAALCGVLVLAAGWVLARRGVAPGTTALGAAAVGLVLYPSAAPGLRASLAAMVAAAVVLALVAGWSAVRRFRAERAAARAASQAATSAPSPQTPAPSPTPPAAPPETPSQDAPGEEPRS